MDAAKKSLAGSRKTQVGNNAKMLQGRAEDSYNSRYKVMKPETGSHKMKSSTSDGTMSQINKMTRGSY